MSRFIIPAVLVFLFLKSEVSGQVITRPGYSLKSHETLEILNVEISAREVVINMSIENRITGGNFCADRNIFIIYPDGTKLKLRSSENIPVCPDTHKFSSPGEKLFFSLNFPPLRQGTEWIDLVEECSDNCFSFYGIILDEELNKRINEAFALVEKGEPGMALAAFVKILEETDNKNLGSEGLLYMNIISLAGEAGNKSMADDWYRRFLTSGAPRLERYIMYLGKPDSRF